MTSTTHGLSDRVASILTLPAYMDSGPEHWQTGWEARHAGFQRVVQRDWHRPFLEEWLAELDAALRSAEHPFVLVAHGLGTPRRTRWPS